MGGNRIYLNNQFHPITFIRAKNLRPSLSSFSDPCLEVNCGKHSKCQIDGTEAFCVCDEGWTYNPKEISAGCVGKFEFNRIWKCLA